MDSSTYRAIRKVRVQREKNSCNRRRWFELLPHAVTQPDSAGHGFGLWSYLVR